MQGDGSPPVGTAPAGTPAVPSVPPPGGTSKGSPPGGHFPGALGGNAPSSPFCSVPKSATGALGPRRATKGNLVALLPAAPPAPTEHHGGSAPPCASPCPRLPPKRRRGGSPGSPPAARAHALLFTSPLRPGGSARHELFPLPSADGEATRLLNPSNPAAKIGPDSESLAVSSRCFPTRAAGAVPALSRVLGVLGAMRPPFPFPNSPGHSPKAGTPHLTPFFPQF